MNVVAGLTIFTADAARSRAFFADRVGAEIRVTGRDSFVATIGGLELAVEGGARPRKRGRHWMEESGVMVRLRVDDFDAFTGGLRERGIVFLGIDEVTEDADGRRFAGFCDPDSNLYEISEL